MNTLKSVFLMTLIMMLFLVVGYALGGQTGLVIAFIFSLAMNFASYWFSDKIVLSMYHAREITPGDNVQLYNLVGTLAKRANIPMPRLYVIDSETPNAFATGRNPENAVVAITTGIVKILNKEELAGVIAHELGHVKNRDILIGSIAATLVGTITFIAEMAGWAAMFGGFGGRSDDDDNGGGNIFTTLLLIILAPIAATLLQLAISRSREYIADASGAEISGNPNALASALNKLVAVNEAVPMQNARPASAHLFIVSPLSGGVAASLFSTHPPIEKRVEKLQELSRTNKYVPAV
jgi:heat shock protein HtpX